MATDDPIRMTVFGKEGSSTFGAGEDPRLEIDPPLPGGAGGGGGGPLPLPRRDQSYARRVASVEEFAGDTRERLARIETKLDHVARDASQWKWFLIGAALTLVLAVVGFGIAIQRMTVATFQAASQQVQQSQQQPVIINVPPATAPAPSRR